MKIVLLIIPSLFLLCGCTANDLIEIRQAMYRMEDKKFREQSAKEVPLVKDPPDSMVETAPPTSS